MGRFDGLICFGGADWWYHNRGHYDIQMCRQFARDMPVLYVNSLGVRMPALSEGSMFLRRIGRKLRSWSRSFVRIDARFGVVSPINIPGSAGRRLCLPILLAQVRSAARRMGIIEPLIWIECPTAALVIDKLASAGLVYQRTDRYEEFPGSNGALIRDCDRKLKSAADLTLFCSRHLFAEESSDCRRARYVDHGVDFDRFRDAGLDVRSQPDDLRDISRPRVGFVGGIDSHTFDAALFIEVAKCTPEMNFVLIGQCSLPSGWCKQPNVHLLGKRPYESVANYMAACDVLIMPWNRNEWIKACNPVKLKEYLAVGRPVVSTPFEELNRYSDCATVAHDASSFAQAIQAALREPAGGIERRRQRVRSETWAAKASQVLRGLAEADLRPATELPGSDQADWTLERSTQAVSVGQASTVGG
jgi:glycosyltransferase involved in cell wall biosynthesis